MLPRVATSSMRAAVVVYLLVTLYTPPASASAAAAAAAGHQILVMSYHNCGSSLLTKLLMMLGMHAGNVSDLAISPGNKLKYFELQSVVDANDRLLAAHSNPSFPSWLAIGFNLSTVLPAELHNYTTAVARQLQLLERRRPWVVKDPRMIWVAPLWLERMDAPVCMFMYRHPQEVASRLSTHWFKGRSQNGTFKAHLHAWAHGMHTALSACVGKPTIVLPHSLLKPDTLMIFVRVLSFELQRVGISVNPISMQELQSEVLQHMNIRQHIRKKLPQDATDQKPPPAMAEHMRLQWDSLSESYVQLAEAMQLHIHNCTMSSTCVPSHASQSILKYAYKT